MRRGRGDPDAFVAFYVRHAEPLFRWFARETSNQVVAADLTAETVAQALLAARRFHGRHAGSGRAWLYTIARRLLARHRVKGCLETRARRRLGMPTSYEDLFVEVDARASAEESRERLRLGIAALPSDQRRTLGLRVVDELSYAEIAERLTCTPATARARVSRALRTLRQHVQGAAT